jgi:hypothetical protein
MLTRTEGGGIGVSGTRGFLGALFLLLLSPMLPGGDPGPSTDGQDKHGNLFSLRVNLGAQEIRYSGSISYSAGRYFFDETTRSFFFGNTLALDIGPFEMSVSVPIVVQNGGLVTLVGGVPVPTGGEQSSAVGGQQSGRNQGSQGGGQGGGSFSLIDPILLAVDGSASAEEETTDIVFRESYSANLADPFFQGSLSLYEGFGFVRSLGARLGVKPPLVGVDSGVGTGEWDFGAGSTFVLAAGNTLVFGDLGYWRYGDLTGLELEDGFSYAGGVSRSFLGTKASMMVTLAGAQALIQSAESPLSAAFGLGYYFENGRMINVSLAAGLSETSPDFSVTLGWTLGRG